MKNFMKILTISFLILGINQADASCFNAGTITKDTQRVLNTTNTCLRFTPTQGNYAGKQIFVRFRGSNCGGQISAEYPDGIKSAQIYGGSKPPKFGSTTTVCKRISHAPLTITPNGDIYENYDWGSKKQLRISSK